MTTQKAITGGSPTNPPISPPPDTSVGGTVIANAGTNLNTAALALEAGGNLAGIYSRLNNAQYVRANFDDNETTKYYGYINSSGYWYIQKEDWTAGTILFAKGTTSYSTNWTGRAGLSYAVYNGFN